MPFLASSFLGELFFFNISKDKGVAASINLYLFMMVAKHMWVTATSLKVCSFEAESVFSRNGDKLFHRSTC